MIRPHAPARRVAARAGAVRRRVARVRRAAVLALAMSPALLLRAASEPSAVTPEPVTTRPAATAPATGPTAAPTTGPSDVAIAKELSRKQEMIKHLEHYYGELYAEPLKIEKNARLAHLVTTISLSRIDAASTSKTLELLAGRGKVDPWVAQLAWEALAARQWSLTPDERAAWLRSGLVIASEGGFPGPTAEPLLRALGTAPLDEAKVNQAAEMILRVAEENDPDLPEGRATLAAAADTVAAWADVKLVERVARNMGKNAALAYRVNLALIKLPSPPSAENPNQLSAAWVKWSKAAALPTAQPLPIPPRPKDPYAPPPPAPKPAATTRPAATQATTAPATTAPATQASTQPATTKPAVATTRPAAPKPPASPPPIVGVFPLGERIYNPLDTKWRTEAELGNLTLTGVEVVFCVDATGSMAESNEFITTYLASSMKALTTISTNVKAAAVYYRHEAEPKLQRDCCKKASTEATNFLFKAFPLTSKIDDLVDTMKKQKVQANAGHDGGSGAYFTGIATAAQILGPKSRKDTARVIVCVGDTFVTPGTEQAMVQLAEKVKEAGIVLVLIVRDKRASDSVAPASQKAIAMDPIIYQNDITRMRAAGADPLKDFPNTSFGKMVGRVIGSVLPPGYGTRVDPMVDGIWRIIRGEQMGINAKARMKG